ncbi:MFS transporter [Thermithiobacillus plumbiphilus]|uniref:MFS transporter n=1 Tax=Thermithiobacillus plumbiphilus TaxID=1729899 RepID=A0ABU9D3X3_9PROT
MSSTAASVDATTPQRGRTVIWALSTYFAQGLPYSIVHQMSAQFFTAAGASLQAIGLTSLYGLAWNLKFLWSPLVDLISTKKSWIIGIELLLAAVVAMLAWPAQGSFDLALAAKIFLVVAFLAATHDIAIDGYYIQSLDDADQAAYSGLRVAAYRVALLVGNGALVVLAGKVSWMIAFLAAAGILALLALMHKLILPPVPASVRQVGGSVLRDAFFSYLRQPHIWMVLGFILLFRAGDAMMFAMSTPLLKELGYDTAARGFLSGTVGTLAGIGGALLGGALISRHGLRRTFFPFALVQSLAIPAYAWMAYVEPGFWGVAFVVGFEQLAAGFGTAALMVFLMQRCQGDYQATHFAIGSALMSVAATFAGSASGFIADSVGFTVFFWFAFALSWPGVILAGLMPARVHHG